MNDVDLARAMRLMTEDAEEIRKELTGGTARGLTSGLHQAIKNLLQSQAQVKRTWEALVAAEKPAPPVAAAPVGLPGRPMPKGRPARLAADAPAPHPVRPSPEAVAQRLAAQAPVAPGSAPPKKGGLTEEGRRALRAAMAARWKDPAFRAKHAAAMAKKAGRAV